MLAFALLPWIGFALLFWAVSSAVVLALLRIDWTPGHYKVIYHRGASVDLPTRASSGWLTVEDGHIRIRGKRGREELSIPLAGLRSAELSRLYGLGRMIRLTHDQSPVIVSVVRFCIAGRFATVDFFKTGKLANLLSAAARADAGPEVRPPPA